MSTKCTFSVILLSALLGLVFVPRTYQFTFAYNAPAGPSIPKTHKYASTTEKRPTTQFQARKQHPVPTVGRREVPVSVRNVVERLKYLESGNRADVVVLDRNARFSYSCLQFQRATFVRYADKYGYPTDKRAMMDCGVQTELAVKMLEEDWSNIFHWRTSAGKLGLL